MSSTKQDAFATLFDEADRLTDTKPQHWKVEPLKYEDWCKEHIRFYPTERQKRTAFMLLGDEPQKSFEAASPYKILCLIAGKGAGKDIFGATVCLYLFYLLLCMEDPRKYLFGGEAYSDSIDMLIISWTEEQARDVSFDKIKQFLRHWAWLRENYTIVEGEKIVTPHKDKPVIIVLGDRITMVEHNIRIIAEHSKNENFEGYSILFFTMSESSAFKGSKKEDNGWQCFRTLRSSASSRFKFGWRGLVYSYPRGTQATDFTFQLYEQAKKDPEIWPDLCYPWQFKPIEQEGDKFFDFEGIQVPLKYQDQANSDPAAFRKMVLCQVPPGGEKAMPLDVIQGALHNFPLLFKIGNHVHLDGRGRYAVAGILDWLETPKAGGHEYLITVDLGLKHSAAAIAASHLHPSMGYVLDAIGTWTPIDPDKTHPKGIPVDLEDVKQVLLVIAAKLPGCIIGFDQWQSELLMVQLGTAGIRTETYHVYEDRDYHLFRKAMASRIAHVPDDPELIQQFNALTMDGKQVVLDTRISTRMDMIDVTVGGFKVLMKSFKPMVMGIPGATYITNNLSQFGGTILPEVQR